MKNLLKLVTFLFIVLLFTSLSYSVLAHGEVKAEFDVDVSAFVDIDSFSTLDVSPADNELGLYSDVTIRVLDRNGTPLSGHTLHLYIEDGEGTVLFIQPTVSDSDGYARGKIRALSEGAFVVRAYDSTYGEEVVLSASDTFYVFPVPVPLLEPEPYYTKGRVNKVMWEDVDGLDEYEYYLQASTDSSYSSIVASSGWVSSFAYEFTGLDGGQIYFYRVKARNSAEAESGWSGSQFSVQDDQAPIIKVSNIEIERNSSGVTNVILKFIVTDDLSLESVVLYCKNQDGSLEECGALENSGSAYTGIVSVSDLERGPLFTLLDSYTFCAQAKDSATNSSLNCDMQITFEKGGSSGGGGGSDGGDVPDGPGGMIVNIVNNLVEKGSDLIRQFDSWLLRMLDGTREDILGATSVILLLLVASLSIAMLTGSFLLVPSYITAWLFNMFKLIGLKPHGRPTGFIYDVVSKKPVRWAFVEIYDGNNNLVWRDFSNPEGEFMADLPAGKYRVSVRTPNYLFPSQLVKPREDRRLGKIYKGEYIMTTKSKPLEIAVPMDPVSMVVGEQFSFWGAKKLGILKSLNIAIVVLGLSLAIYLFGRSPSLMTSLILLLYIPAVSIYLKSLFKLGLRGE